MEVGEIGCTKKGNAFVYLGKDKKGTTIQWLGGDKKKVKLLNVNGRAEVFGQQLKSKKDKKGNKLTPAKAGFRIGYLSRGADGARAYNAKKGKPNKSKYNPMSVTITLD